MSDGIFNDCFIAILLCPVRHVDTLHIGFMANVQQKSNIAFLCVLPLLSNAIGLLPSIIMPIA